MAIKFNKFIQSIFPNPTQFLVDGVQRTIVGYFGTPTQEGTPYTAATFNELSKNLVYSMDDTSVTPNVITCSLTGLTELDLSSDFKALITPNYSNSEAVTVEINGDISLELKKENNLSLTGGEVVAGQPVFVNYNAGGYFKLINKEILEISASGILDKLKTVDGTGSGLDADLFDGKNSTEFQPVCLKGTATIPITGWVSNTGDYKYKLNLAISGVVATDTVYLMLDKDVQDVASSCGMCPSIDEYTGGVTLYVQSIPTASMSVKYLIER